VCVPCRWLHKMENLQRYNSTTYSVGSTIRQYNSLRLLTYMTKDRNDDTGRINDSFGAAAFKMAIKRHQQPGCTRLLSIISNQVAQTVEHGAYVRQSREECRVIREHLMHRLWNVYISFKCLNSTPLVDDLYPEIICPDIKLRSNMLENRSGLRSCRECPFGVIFHRFLASFLVCSTVSHNVLEPSFVLTTPMRWNSVPLDSVLWEVLRLKYPASDLSLGCHMLRMFYCRAWRRVARRQKLRHVLLVEKLRDRGRKQGLLDC
jgi:hypothetical protein